jgi:hypothetical protein
VKRLRMLQRFFGFYDALLALFFFTVVSFSTSFVVVDQIIAGHGLSRVFRYYKSFYNAQDVDRNGFNRPVLKHGPRSLTCMRVLGRNINPFFLMRSESKCRWDHYNKKKKFFFFFFGNVCTIDRSGLFI